MSARVVLINGSFGVGKTTTAHLLQGQLRGSIVYDPEVVGSLLRRLPGWVPTGRQRTDDFQDLKLWRRLTVAGIAIAEKVATGPVVVPMTFSRTDYFDEITSGVHRHCGNVAVFCLQASLKTIHERLEGRGTSTRGPGSEWIQRRTAECCAALQGDRFGVPLDTECYSAQELAVEIATRIAR